MAELPLPALALILARGGNAWAEAVHVLVARSGADVALVKSGNPSTTRLASHGVLPQTAVDSDGEAEARAALVKAGFTTIWTQAFTRGGERTGFIVLARRTGTWHEDAGPRAIEGELPVVAMDLAIRAADLAREAERDLRRQVEGRLGEIERQSNVGAVAAAVAHDMAAPVSALLMEGAELRDRIAYLRTLLPNAGPILGNVLDDLAGLAGHCNEATERARQLLIDFRLAAHPRTESPAAAIAVDTGDTLRSCVRLVLPLARNKVRVDLVVAPDLPRIPGSRKRLEQAFTNLLVNAVHAASVREGYAGRVHAEARRAENEIIVEIRDNGPGISGELKPRIFEPFFTTKGPGIGTGLGLPLARDAVEAHGGRLELESEPGHGACFRARLPVAPIPAHATPTHARPRILVVDSEHGVASALERILRSDYDVTVGRSGADVLDLLTAGARYDALIVDVSLRDVAGPELYDAIRERWPGVERKLIFTSNGSFSSGVQEFLNRVPNSRFAQPITREELRPIVQLVVAA
jgi:signal transduction histidine kinase